MNPLYSHVEYFYYGTRSLSLFHVENLPLSNEKWQPISGIDPLMFEHHKDICIKRRLLRPFSPWKYLLLCCHQYKVFRRLIWIHGHKSDQSTQNLVSSLKQSLFFRTRANDWAVQIGYEKRILYETAHLYPIFVAYRTHSLLLIPYSLQL